MRGKETCHWATRTVVSVSDREFRSSLGQQPKGDDMSSVPLSRLHYGSIPLVSLDIGLHAQRPGLSLYYSKKEKGNEILRSPK